MSPTRARETHAEASARRACLVCGESGARTFKLEDGRVVRACNRCLTIDYVCNWLQGEEVFDDLDPQ